MNQEYTIRRVTVDDATRIAEIYNYYVEHTIVTFEEMPVDKFEMEKRIQAIAIRFPYLVLEQNREVIGYAYATEWKTRSAYRYSAENTIYLDHLKIGNGAGSLLFEAFLTEVKKTNLHSLVGGIALPNPASIALHEKFGFKMIGTFGQIGFKFGKWIDVGYWEYFNQHP